MKFAFILLSYMHTATDAAPCKILLVHESMLFSLYNLSLMYTECKESESDIATAEDFDFYS